MGPSSATVQSTPTTPGAVAAHGAPQSAPPSLWRRNPEPGFKTVFFVRHGEALHNATGDLSIRDPRLTPLGRSQAGSVKSTSTAILEGRELALVVASPMRRALETALLAFGDEAKGDQAKRLKFVAHPDAQEAGAHPSDTGSDAAELKAEFGDAVDLELCTAQWFTKTAPFDLRRGERDPIGISDLRVRLDRLTQWLLARPEHTIALVAHHGVFAHLLGIELANCEVIEASLDNKGWSIQRAASTVVQVHDGRGRMITNYYGQTLVATLTGIRATHSKNAVRRSASFHIKRKDKPSERATIAVAGGEDDIYSLAARPSLRKLVGLPSALTVRKHVISAGVAALLAITGSRGGDPTGGGSDDSVSRREKM